MGTDGLKLRRVGSYVGTDGLKLRRFGTFWGMEYLEIELDHFEGWNTWK